MDMKNQKRCAIYTRKSSEEGLDRSFNSLHAQREAAEAYIKSQSHEGWVLNTKEYDDGGFSGGSVDRPGLQQLLQDVTAGHIDIIVVYKVDRLSRSLNDFAKMMDLFDQHNVSFVSITQSFNTTTSMGRLTLNILLSFAQFEREVTGERIRDKIALSKRKGMWMGGRVPLGYDAVNRQLTVNFSEAAAVKHIFSSFLRLKSVTLLVVELKHSGYKSKSHKNRNGTISGGIPFTRPAIYKLLNRRLYLGEIEFKGEIYEGQHQAIIDKEMWNEVQALLNSDNLDQRAKVASTATAPLLGLLYGPDGQAMTSTHTRTKKKRYRYYVTHQAQKYGHRSCPLGMIPAGDIEGIVFDQLKAMFKQPQIIIETWRLVREEVPSVTEHQIRQNLQSIETLWDHLFHNEQARLLELFIKRIVVSLKDVTIQIRSNGIDDLARSIQSINKKQREA